MPYLNCKLSVEESEDLAKEIANILLRNTSEILNKKAEVTAINIEFVSSKYWFIGDTRDKKSFFLDIKITKDTNTKEQKSEYINKVYKDMKSILGDINSTSYIVIDEVPSNSWGYDGFTQEYRFKEQK